MPVNLTDRWTRAAAQIYARARFALDKSLPHESQTAARGRKAAVDGIVRQAPAAAICIIRIPNSCCDTYLQDERAAISLAMFMGTSTKNRAEIPSN